VSPLTHTHTQHLSVTHTLKCVIRKSTSQEATRDSKREKEEEKTTPKMMDNDDTMLNNCGPQSGAETVYGTEDNNMVMSEKVCIMFETI